ncbi:zinc dependent phospholipase C family protein [Arundinibacter roseus]|uniref:Integrase n=1 Tax=Arundinibacter roseus TaxID=2070510 RepID=A0A4R4KDF6_9BACT|nr:zinc dependent phospholipase C family protein [Arundinibacter roseus]TDB64551.1 integrase [Arundinibacter roseus]
MIIKKLSIFISLLFSFFLFFSANPHWGFWGHRRINRLAVYRLPPEMQLFFKKNIDYITENAVNPDRRRYAVVGEAERHFIDLDVYGDSAFQILPLYWNLACEKFGEDSLRKHGIVPWYIQTATFQLTEAMRSKNKKAILRIAADLGHYVADANVPLHTTKNYNGQLTGQLGIHAFWESRLPELFADDYDLWIGRAQYQEQPAKTIWKAVAHAHAALDSVLLFEKQLTEKFSPEQKYSYTQRNNILVRSYSTEFSTAYHQALAGQVERQMRAAVRLTGDLWYTSWVNAGQPDLSLLLSQEESEEDKKQAAAEAQGWFRRLLKVRTEADDETTD